MSSLCQDIHEDDRFSSLLYVFDVFLLLSRCSKKRRRRRMLQLLVTETWPGVGVRPGLKCIQSNWVRFLFSSLPSGSEWSHCQLWLCRNCHTRKNNNFLGKMRLWILKLREPYKPILFNHNCSCIDGCCQCWCSVFIRIDRVLDQF